MSDAEFRMTVLQSLSSLQEKVDGLLDGRSQTHEAWMSTKEAAKYLGMTPRSVRVSAELGRLPGRKNRKSRGSRWFFRRAQLDKWLVTGNTPATAEATIWQ